MRARALYGLARNSYCGRVGSTRSFPPRCKFHLPPRSPLGLLKDGMSQRVGAAIITTMTVPPRTRIEHHIYNGGIP
jgi:hypothetical protein